MDTTNRSGIDNALEAGRYGNLARVAIGFYVSTGNPAELDAATCYGRAAAYWANRAIDGIEWHQPSSTCVETLGGDMAIRLTRQINVF